MTNLESLWFVSVSMNEETNQLVFLVGLQHDVRHGGRGGRHTNLTISTHWMAIDNQFYLKKEESPVKVLEKSVDHTSIVIIEK